jgi:hypothetical protein
MFNLALSIRPVTILPEPIAFKGQLYQMAVGISVPLSQKDEPLVTAMLSPLESNQSKGIGQYFKGIQELPQADQEDTLINVGGLAYATDHYKIDKPNDDVAAVYTSAMQPFRISAEVLGETGDAICPDITLFVDTATISDKSGVQSYYSMDCGYILTYANSDGRLSYKLQSRGPTLDNDLSANASFYMSPSKTVQRELKVRKEGETASAAVSGNIGAYIGQDGTAKLRFSVSRMFIGKVYDRNNQVQRETMQPVQFTKQENAAIASLRSRLGRVTADVLNDDY